MPEEDPLEKLLPQSVDAERGVLGCIILDPYIGVADLPCHSEDFYREIHRHIYAAIERLDARHVPPDVITLSEELERHSQLEGVGGFSYLAGLVNDVPTSGGLQYYAQIVTRKAMHRRLIHAAGRIAALAYEEAEGALEQAEHLLFEVYRARNDGAFVSLASIMADYMQELEVLAAHKSELVGVPTGFHDIDDMLGGLQKTDFLVLGGRPGCGKTSLALNIAYNASFRYGKQIAIFSLEMGRAQLARRFMSMVSEVDMQRLRKGWFDNDWEALVSAHGNLSDIPVWINDVMGNPLPSMRSQYRQLLREAGKIDLVIVDYLQLIDPQEENKGNRTQAIDEISRGLKGFAREFDVPVLALASLSRAVEARSNKMPILSDLRESGGIESDADVVMLVYRDDYYAEMEGRPSKRPHIADIAIAKQRNGPTGPIALHFQKELTRFQNLDEHMEVQV